LFGPARGLHYIYNVIINNMNKYEIEVVIEALRKQLDTTEQMWNNKESHAQIVGYLQGTVKGVISHLETKI
jgi:hypothetical protein